VQILLQKQRDMREAGERAITQQQVAGIEQRVEAVGVGQVVGVAVRGDEVDEQPRPRKLTRGRTSTSGGVHHGEA